MSFQWTRVGIDKQTGDSHYPHIGIMAMVPSNRTTLHSLLGKANLLGYETALLEQGT